MGTTAPASNVGIQEGGNITLITDGANSGGGNVGGLQNNFHRFKLDLKMAIAPGATHELVLKYYLPVSMPSNWVIKFGEGDKAMVLALQQEHPFLPAVDLSKIGACDDDFDISGLTEAPNWLTLGWDGNPTNATSGQMYTYQGAVWLAKGWTADLPVYTDEWGVWEKVCTIQ
jgi:hypothetical protein